MIKKGILLMLLLPATTQAVFSQQTKIKASPAYDNVHKERQAKQKLMLNPPADIKAPADNRKLSGDKSTPNLIEHSKARSQKQKK